MTRMKVKEFKELNTSTKVKRSKYGNKKTVYQGETYDSKKEADYAGILDALRKAKNKADRVISIERQVKYVIEIRSKKICTYIADFKVKYADGHEEVIDVKGFKTSIYRLKKKLVEACYDIIIKEV